MNDSFNSDFILINLTDDELIDYANQHLNNISEHNLMVLRGEFTKRKIDFTSYYSSEIYSNYDKSKDFFTLWEFAFGLKKNNKSDCQILIELDKKGIDKSSAELLLKRLPNLDFNDSDFNELLRDKIENSSTMSSLMFFFLFLISLYLFYKVVETKEWLILIPAIIMGAGGYFIYKKSSNKDASYWIDLINKNPRGIVWIKPITLNHTIAVVITLFKKKKYQLFTDDMQSAIIDIETYQEEKVFFNGIKNLLPHVHIGYKSEIESIYSLNTQKFIPTLISKKIYTPFDQFQL